MVKVIEYQVSKVDEHGDLYEVDHTHGSGNKQKALKKAKEWIKETDPKMEKVIVERKIDYYSKLDGTLLNREYGDAEEFYKRGQKDG